jgi:hypothetical protein
MEQIHVVISELDLTQSGGSAVLSYEISYDKGTNKAEWEELKGFSANDASLEATKTGLIFQEEYYVRYRAKNIFGWGEYSEIFSIITIMVPDVPQTLTV